MSYYKVNDPKIHDLEELLNILQKELITIELENENHIDLDDYAVEGRYAVIHDDFEDAEIYIRLIEKLKYDVRTVLFPRQD